MKFSKFLSVAAALAVTGHAGAGSGLRACGPWLPEQILTSRQVILRTPVGDFAREVTALTPEDGAPALPPGCLRTPPAENPAEDVPATTDAVGQETAELRDALKDRGVAADRQERIAVAFQVFRTGLAALAGGIRQSKTRDGDEAGFRFDERAHDLQGVQPPPAPGSVPLPPDLSAELPPEWTDYLDGAWHFWHGDVAGARVAWERLLARPQAERLYCSTRAAYMLARILDDPTAPPADNARRYERVRQLRADGCHDLYNLASDSFGWEARLALDAKDNAAALRLYYLQAVSVSADSTDFTASSLRTVTGLIVDQGLADPAALAASARDPFVRRTVTLYLACHRSFNDDDAHMIRPVSPQPASEPDAAAFDRKKTELAWLDALTGAGVNAVREAAPIAWAAYEKADYPQAAAWLDKAPADDGLALWLRAKLALRDGKTDEAARCFAGAVRSYPVEAKEESNGIDASTGLARDGTAFRSRQFQADLGILCLARSDYAQALTALLRSGFWNDAAYVAERVMTVDELRAYVRVNFPQAPPLHDPAKAAGADAEDTRNAASALQTIQGKITSDHYTNPAAYSLRYLLARRLARAARSADAREFYPQALRFKFDEYVAARKLGGDARQPKAKRADALWREAKITRWLGMELFGTEDEPDWFVYDGAYDYGSYYRQARLERPQSTDANGDSVPGPGPTPEPPFVPPVGKDEKRRVEKDQLRPEKRYHYRYGAAELAWMAAALMPDQQEATARVLAAGGLWLDSVHETKAADRFYLAILRRCGRTGLGREADKTGKIPDVAHEDP